MDETLAGRGADLKEYVIGVQVLGRPATFDPRTDASVRVAARRLRQKVDEYYATEGQSDEVVLTLERGGYQPQFQRRSPEGRHPGEGLPEPQPASLHPQPQTDGRAPEAPEVDDGPASPSLGTSSLPESGVTPGRTVSGPRAAATARSRVRMAGVGVAIALGVLAAAAWAWTRLRPTAPAAQVIAVLPFTNATADEAYAHVCFGVVEDLTTALTDLEGMEVIARTSASQFSGTGQDLVAVGKKLGADLLIEGSVRRDAGRVFVTAQLIEARKGTHLWAGAYDGNVAEGVAAQQEIARSIANAVRDRLGRKLARVASPRPPAPEALELYWKGRFAQVQQPADSVSRAIDYFTQAVVRDPSYAEARAALGGALATQAFHHVPPAPDIVERARLELRQALTLDPTSGSALTSMAWIAFYYDHDWPSADRGFRRALALNPSNASAHNLYALSLIAHNRFAEAIEHSRLALRYDPVRYAARNDSAVILWCARRYSEAEAAADGIIDAEPDYHVARLLRGMARMGRGDVARAALDLEAARKALGPVSQILARQVCVYAAQGDLARARTVLAELDQVCARNEGFRVHLAIALAALGEEAAALDRLEQAEARRESDVNYITVEPTFDRLRATPRFRAVVARLGLGS